MEQPQPFRPNDTALVNGREYRIVKLLGKGKGGYSYLAVGDATGRETGSTAGRVGAVGVAGCEMSGTADSAPGGATNGETRVVLKQIHHEPCDYYQFGNKLEAELRDYQRLWGLGIPMPRLLAFDGKAERIVKEYIDGPTVNELVQNDALPDPCLAQVRQMCALLYPAGLNIDYYPTNFVLQGETLYYIDYECNAYSDEWNFENWGIRYWSKTPEFLKAFF